MEQQVPDLTVRLAPIRPLRIIKTSLSEAVASETLVPPVSSGFLTMDEGRGLLLLADSDGRC